MRIKDILFILPLLFIVACGKDEPTPEQGVYQEYEVLVTPAYKAAFANLRENTATGQRLYFEGNDVLTVNTLRMYYQQVTTASNTAYNYSAQIDDHHQKAIFNFKHGGKTYVNEVNFDILPDITIPASMSSIRNEEVLPIDMSAVQPAEVDAYLSTTITALESNVYKARVNLANGAITFTGVPAGVYDLYIDQVRVLPTTQNDGTASGSIRLIKRQSRRMVRVEI